MKYVGITGDNEIAVHYYLLSLGLSKEGKQKIKKAIEGEFKLETIARTDDDKWQLPDHPSIRILSEYPRKSYEKILERRNALVMAP